MKKNRFKKKYIDSQKALMKFHYAIDNVFVTIVITDIEGNISYVNKQFVKSTGYSKKEAIGQNPRILKSGHQPDEYYKELWNTISSGKTWHGVFYNKRKDNTYYWETATIHPIFNKKNKITEYISFKYDITEKKTLEKSLIEAKEKAEKADKLKTAFLANISHEIRTPLNAIIGFTEIIAQNISDNKLKFYAEIVKNNGQDLINIMTNLLDLAKIEAGYTPLFEQEFNLNELLIELYEYINLKREILKKKDIDIIYYTPASDKDAIINADRGRIKQVLVNLLENALKFTYEGKIEIGYHFKNNKKNICFYVHDTGIGIVPEKQKIIFERFRQSEEGSTRKYGGTGIGLSISKSLAELLGGTLSVKSEKAKGSTFYLDLPCQSIKLIKKKKIIKYNIPDHKNILLIEDEYVNYELIKELLADYKFNIEHVPTAVDAINYYTKNKNNINLVLMDIRLPDIDGYELTRILKKIKDIPVIITSAYVSKESFEEAEKIGCNDFISKPINPDKLYQTIEKYL